MNKPKKEICYIDIYKKKMEGIDFMVPYMDDVSIIFNPYSSKCKQFLIDSFTYLNSHFHYLPFSNKDEVDRELLKAAQILQIHPLLPNKEKIFEGLDANEVHKFWMRLFSCFELRGNQKNDSSVSLKFINPKLGFLNNVTDALNYFNYQFQIVNPNKVKKYDVQAEIIEWNSLQSSEDVPQDFSIESPVINKNEDIIIDKPIDDIKCLAEKYDLLHLKPYQKNEMYEDFFKNFTDLAKGVADYVDNVKKIESFTKKDIVSDLTVASDDFELPNMNQVKKCQELLKKIELKKKDMDY